MHTHTIELETHKYLTTVVSGEEKSQTFGEEA